MKTTFPKAEAQAVCYRDCKNLDLYNFSTEYWIEDEFWKGLLTFRDNFPEGERHASMKKKILRANNNPYMTKEKEELY